MKVASRVSLKAYNTFGINSTAQYFAEVSSVAELQELLGDEQWQRTPKLILGGGSNLLFTSHFNGLVIKIGIGGIEVVEENHQEVWIKVGAGENWHQLVIYCIERVWGGIENLSLIPGTVGAAPMQNIGAYGVEIKDVFESLEAVEI
ncbi:MAG: FAD-binding protein, partial [Cyclobacteriaceae bacterium]